VRVGIGVRSFIQQGALVELFSDWLGESFPLYALYPSSHLPAAWLTKDWTRALPQVRGEGEEASPLARRGARQASLIVGETDERFP
jgi:hypothetical protein